MFFGTGTAIVCGLPALYNLSWSRLGTAKQVAKDVAMKIKNPLEKEILKRIKEMESHELPHQRSPQFVGSVLNKASKTISHHVVSNWSRNKDT